MDSMESKLVYPDLPVSGAREEVLAALRECQVVVVVGATGSGKTTQLPKMALEWLAEQGGGKKSAKLIGCTQPRRIAAASVAQRVADELSVNLGAEVGYQVRFDDRYGDKTRIKFMTDGILLAETQGDAALNNYGVIIIDEAHERSLNIDFLLGYLKRLVERRKDLRVIISSATLDAGGFSDFFNQAPMIDVEGRTFPVETVYLPERSDEDTSRHVARAVESLNNDLGDVLVFLPGEREIRECADVLEGRGFRNTEILPLYARMGMAEQQRVFTTKSGVRRVVLATNVAETSLTIPGIVYVVDAGLARVSRWNPSRQVQRLQVEPVSQASANQRKGRCGRVSEGVCIRLYSEEDFLERGEFTDPEIRRSSLGGVILRMKSLHLPEIEEFPFIDPPSSKLVAEGYRTLREIGALKEVDDGEELSKLGWKLARVPVEPRLARMLLESVRTGCYEEMLVIVSGLSVMDPRERPSDKQKEADAAHKRWDDEESDFISILHLWSDLQGYREKNNWKKNQLRKFCKRSFLNFRRVLEWGNLHKELRHVQLGQRKGGVLGELNSWASNEVIHKALLVGMPRQVGRYDKEARCYKGVNAREFAIFPGSGMFGKKKPEWVLAYDMVDTSRLWARRVATIGTKWLEDVVGHLCRYRYNSAKWDVKQGAVYASEVVMFGPLKIIDGRRVHFGRIDPKASWKIFVREGLLGGGLHGKRACLKRMRSLKSKVEDMEQKLRRLGGIWSDEKVVEFFEANVPQDIFTAKAYNKWEKEHGDALLLEMADVMYDEVEDLEWEMAGYPDSLGAEGEYRVYYNVAPGAVDDGVTLGVHVDQLEISCSEKLVDLMEWGVPGMLEERVFLLIRSLPKGQRVACQPVAERAKRFVGLCATVEDFEGGLLEELGRYLTQQIGVRIEAGMFDFSRLPEEMQTKIWVCGDEGEELAMGKSVEEVRKKLSGLLAQRFKEESGAEWEMSGMHGWECGELPEKVIVREKEVYPALCDEGDSVGVKVCFNEWDAERSHRGGCVRLFLFVHVDQARYVSKNLPISMDVKMYLPHLGKGLHLSGSSGVTQAEFLRCAAEGVFAGKSVRDANAFARVSAAGRGELFTCAQELGQGFEEVITISREMEKFVDQYRGDDHLGEVADDIRWQMGWLLRSGFLKQIGWEGVMKYPRYFRGMQERIKRMKSLPVVKDLDKMDRVHALLTPWEDTWLPKKDDGKLLRCGYLLEELRLLIFAPSMVIKGAVSEKLLRKELAACGVLV